MFRRNTYLWSVIVVGAIVTTVGGTGIFAVFNDRASQILPNTIESGPQSKAADVQIATLGPTAGEGCTNWQENLGTPLWSVTNLQPGDSHMRTVCLRNVGSASVALTASVLDLVGSDNQCTGDEHTVDPTCAGGQGQLADALKVDILTVDCLALVAFDTAQSYGLTGLIAAPAPVGPAFGLLAGTTTCLQMTVRYPSTTALNTIQAAQSDGVSWKFAFDATAL